MFFFIIFFILCTILLISEECLVFIGKKFFNFVKLVVRIDILPTLTCARIRQSSITFSKLIYLYLLMWNRMWILKMSLTASKGRKQLRPYSRRQNDQLPNCGTQTKALKRRRPNVLFREIASIYIEYIFLIRVLKH